MLENYENLNSMDYILKELDSSKSDIFVYQDVKKINKSVTIIQGLKDKDISKTILRELKKNIGTGGYYKNGLIILQGNHKDYVNKYLVDNNILN
ncbi:MAG: stress response translation initiation inhibitor YciH [Nitrososphaeraceae archaeon]